ncbi:MAG: haloacid dehalogenase [Candidatus Gerdarchaeota archaeon]|nr:MAG: haloacid dehalogenase [Candidatus Gerdarchaeota archaeon]
MVLVNDKEISAVLFDLDDTLFNSSLMSLRARRNSIRAMIEAGLEIEEEEGLQKLLAIVEKYGSNYGQHFNRLLDELGVKDQPKLIAAAIVAYHSTKQALLRPYPGVITTLLTLMKKVKIGIVSDGVKIKQWEKLTYLGLQHFFDVVIVNEKKNEWKPAKDGYEKALKQLRITEPERVIYVGNKIETDILGANNLGIISVLFDPQKKYSTIEKKDNRKPDFVVHHFKAILKLLEIKG